MPVAICLANPHKCWIVSYTWQYCPNLSYRMGFPSRFSCVVSNYNSFLDSKSVTRFQAASIFFYRICRNKLVSFFLVATTPQFAHFRVIPEFDLFSILFSSDQGRLCLDQDHQPRRDLPIRGISRARFRQPFLLTWQISTTAYMLCFPLETVSDFGSAQAGLA